MVGYDNGLHAYCCWVVIGVGSKFPGDMKVHIYQIIVTVAIGTRHGKTMSNFPKVLSVNDLYECTTS